MTRSALKILACRSPLDMQVYTAHMGWIAAFVILQLALSIRALPWIWALRERWLAAAGLGVALISAWLHQFALCGASIALLLLTGLVAPDELKDRGARAYVLALIACGAFWPAFGVLTGAWRQVSASGALPTHPWLGLVEHLGGFPRVFDEILRPWGRTMPVLTMGVSLLGAALAVLVVSTATQSIGGHPSAHDAAPRVDTGGWSARARTH